MNGSCARRTSTLDCSRCVEELSRRSPLAIVTNKPLAPTSKIVEALGLQPFFRTVIGGDGPFPRKPNPSSLHHLMETFGVTARQTVLVGDSRIDFETARAARNVHLPRALRVRV